jgi:hypothetical protein
VTVNSFGVPLTSDGSGAGTPLAPTAGTITYYGAIALDPGVAGDIIEVYVMPTLSVA